MYASFASNVGFVMQSHSSSGGGAHDELKDCLHWSLRARFFIVRVKLRKVLSTFQFFFFEIQIQLKSTAS